VLGTPTFGKGLVQTVFRLGPQQALQLTTGRWYTPSGRTIQRPMRRVGGVLRIVGGAEHQLDDVPGDTAVADSSALFYTDAGRAMKGGGGIRPDIIVRLDTLTDGEKAFTSAVGAQAQVYRDVVTSYALEIKASGSVTDPDFRTTASMRDEAVRRLRARGVDLPREVVAGGHALLDQQIALEITRYVFGRDVESQRRMRDDRQVQRALAILEDARSPEQLLNVAGREGGNR
jgi:carboxyl-terminal processing protease